MAGLQLHTTTGAQMLPLERAAGEPVVTPLHSSTIPGFGTSNQAGVAEFGESVFLFRTFPDCLVYENLP